jgi:hypothetical protein
MQTIQSGKQPPQPEAERNTTASRIKSACQRDPVYSKFKKGVIFFVFLDCAWLGAIPFVKNETIFVSVFIVIFIGLAVCGVGFAARGSMLVKQVKSNEPRT